MTTDPTVFIVDDDAALRDSLAVLMEAEGLAARCFETAESFLDGDLSSLTGCVLADVRMPGMDGLALLAGMVERKIGLPVIMMTGHADVPLAVAAMKAGALDFIEKPLDIDRLLPILRAACRTSAELLLARSVSDGAADRLAGLTPREQDVLALLVEGHPNKVIAFNLSISPRTVEIHRARIMEKTKVRSLSELVRLAVSAGIEGGRHPEGSE